MTCFLPELAEGFLALDREASRYKPGDPPEYLCRRWLNAAERLDKATRHLPSRPHGRGITYVDSLRAVAEHLTATAKP